jgi:hypothetical protein
LCHSGAHFRRKSAYLGPHILRCADDFHFQSHLDKYAMHDPVEASLDMGGDMDPATNTEETHVTLGAKRKVAGLAGLTTRWARNHFNFTRILIMHSQVEAVSSN